MISSALLTMTNNRALGFLIYGQGGTRKTNGIHTLPPPILLHDTEGGTSSILPWIRRQKRWDGEWQDVSEADRQLAFSLLSKENAVYIAETTRIASAPYIDVIYYDILVPESYTTFVKNIGDLDVRAYNSLAVDSLQELSMDTQTFSKKQAGVDVLEPMHVKLWTGAQERMKIQLRKMKNYRDQGVFIYFTCSETIDKDYVTDPRSAPPGAPPEQPYSVKGTVNLAGQLVPTVQHVCDIMAHAKPLNGQVMWITKQEALPAGGAYWEAKDRTGRIAQHYNDANIRKILDQIYGEDIRKRIYSEGIRLCTAGG